MFRSAAATDPGRVNAVNEDAVFADDSRALWIVSDGVGSTRGAAAASAWVIESIAKALVPPAPSVAAEIRPWIARAIRAASARLATEAKTNPALDMMSSTLTLLTVAGTQAAVAQIGDSRGYRLRGGRLEQITNDHSVAFEQYKAGAITKSQLRTHPNQRLLTRTLGPGREPPPEITVMPIQPGDRYLLCSDGLTKELDDADIEAILRSAGDPADHVRKLIDAANARGGHDNITAVVVDL